jgi:hypothetical protein
MARIIRQVEQISLDPWATQKNFRPWGEFFFFTSHLLDNRKVAQARSTSAVTAYTGTFRSYTDLVPKATIENKRGIIQTNIDMFLFYLLVAYIVLLIVMRCFENRMIFFPNYPSRLEGDWHPRTLAPEDVWLITSDGTKLHAWWIFNPDAKFTFLAFHGNASNIANREATYEFLRDVPGNVLALEYRGYGHSEGKPSEAGLYLDAAWLVSKRSPDPRYR